MLRTDNAGHLVPIYLAWKALLVTVAAFSPFPGYDTSALVLQQSGQRYARSSASSSLIDRLSLNLLRWDALYFVKAAQRDYVYEQEWAFSWVHSRILRLVGNLISFESSDPSLQHYIWAGIAVSNICHLLSVLVLHRLLSSVLSSHQNRNIPFIASVLHIFSPAGLFLSAPYAEALFSFLNFTGMLHYVLARGTSSHGGTRSLKQDAYMLSSGLFFASATLIRSNGLLSGLIFLYDVVLVLPDILAFKLDKHDARRIFVTCVAGVVLAAGFIYPQVLAYLEYCNDGGSSRPWCEKSIPSIYTWVQSHYWNVGFLRYWTISNLPLFLLATPMLWLLTKTSLTILAHILPRDTSEARTAPAKEAPTTQGSSSVICHWPQLALPQLLLAVMAATNFHVQIISRISSGYPMWYLVVAKWVVDDGLKEGNGSQGKASWPVRFTILYALIQGALYANFLPPA